MNIFKHISLIIVFLISSLTCFSQAQPQEELSLNDATIPNQFEYVLRKSGNFKGTDGQPYEAVKRSMFFNLRDNTIDSLNTLKTKLENSKITVEAQKKEVNDLKAKLESTQTALDTTKSEKDSMSLIGMQMSKTGYNVLMWTIIAGLLALFLLFVYKFKNSNAVTREAKKALEDIEEQFDDHRRVALEREQKVRRQLQDEINKQKGI